MMKEVTIETGARLHLGLLDLTGDLGRVDGGLGIALSRPRLVIKASKADDVSSTRYSRLAKYAVHKLNLHFGLKVGLDIEVLEYYPQHVGLGSTTQILLSVATAYEALYGKRVKIREIADVLGRGGTSGIGLAAFERGGFILDGGHSFGPGRTKRRFLPSRASHSPPPPILFRSNLPANWIIDVIVPLSTPGLSGKSEIDFFTKNCPIVCHETYKIAHIVLSYILPSVVECDITSFIEGINLLTTLGFKKLEIANQSKLVNQILQNLKNITHGTAAISLSSFGPTVFVISDNKSRSRYSDHLVSYINDIKRCTNVLHYTTCCRNKGATII